MKQRTFAIIKPDAVRQQAIGPILNMAAENNMHPVAMLMTEMPVRFWREFYGAHEDKPFFGPLIEFMLSGPVVLLILEGDEVVRRWRELMGATDPTKADLFTIREKFGTEGPANAVHGSDSQESALDEVRLVRAFIGHGRYSFSNYPIGDELGLSGLVED